MPTLVLETFSTTFGKRKGFSVRLCYRPEVYEWIWHYAVYESPSFADALRKRLEKNIGNNNPYRCLDKDYWIWDVVPDCRYPFMRQPSTAKPVWVPKTGSYLLNSVIGT